MLGFIKIFHPYEMFIRNGLTHITFQSYKKIQHKEMPEQYGKYLSTRNPPQTLHQDARIHYHSTT
jgi:hypothetical protein